MPADRGVTFRPSIRARRVASVALFVAMLALAWSALVLTGGFEVRIFGATIRSHDALRPFVVGAAALIAFLGIGGFTRIAVTHVPIVAALAASVCIYAVGLPLLMQRVAAKPLMTCGVAVLVRP